MPMNYPNNDNGLLSVSTNSIAIFAQDSTMLRLGFKNDLMFLTIIPRVEDPSGGKARWPKEMGHTVSFKAHQAYALYEGFKQTILPDIQEKKDHVGYCVVPLNRESSTLCGFSYAGGRAVFSIFMSVGMDRTCSETYSFMFEPTSVIDTYNPTTGAYSTIEVQAQLFIVVEALRVFGEFGGNFVGHSAKNAMGWNTNQIISYLKAIATKMNVDIPNTYSFSGNGNGYAPVNHFPAVSSAAAAQPTLNTANDVNMSAVNWSSSAQAEAASNIAPIPQVEAVTSLDSLIG